jgi:hypothetical protein
MGGCPICFLALARVKHPLCLPLSFHHVSLYLPAMGLSFGSGGVYLPTCSIVNCWVWCCWLHALLESVFREASWEKDAAARLAHAPPCAYLHRSGLSSVPWPLALGLMSLLMNEASIYWASQANVRCVSVAPVEYCAVTQWMEAPTPSPPRDNSAPPTRSLPVHRCSVCASVERRPTPWENAKHEDLDPNGYKSK